MYQLGLMILADISIHSPHARGDEVHAPEDLAHMISIHSPHARGDKRCQSGMKTFGTFQSTPLMRGETAEFR